MTSTPSRCLLARAEHWLEALIFASRWLIAPFYLGLVIALYRNRETIFVDKIDLLKW